MSRQVKTDEREVARGYALILSSFLLQCRCGEVDNVEIIEVRKHSVPNIIP